MAVGIRLFCGLLVVLVRTLAGDVIAVAHPGRHHHSKAVSAESPAEYRDVETLESLLQSNGTIYAIKKEDKAVYAQAWDGMTTSSRWTYIAAGPVRDIAVAGDTIYAVPEGSDGRVFREQLSLLATKSDRWGKPCAAGPVEAIAVDQGTMYAVRQGKLYRQQLDQMTLDSQWILVSATASARSVAAHAGDIYIVRHDGTLWRNRFRFMDVYSPWHQMASETFVGAVALIGDDAVLGVMDDDRIHTRRLSRFLPGSRWSPVQLAGSAGGLSCITVPATPAAPPRVPELEVVPPLMRRAGGTATAAQSPPDRKRHHWVISTRGGGRTSGATTRHLVESEESLVKKEMVRRERDRRIAKEVSYQEPDAGGGQPLDDEPPMSIRHRESPADVPEGQDTSDD